MGKMKSRAVLFAVACAASAQVPHTSCTFAHTYTCGTLVANASAVAALVLDVAAAERAFASPGVGIHAATGMTVNGAALDDATGAQAGPQQLFSAPSKESIHLGMLARAVAGHDAAVLFAGGTVGAAVDALALKMTALEGWVAARPGYGGFLPWFQILANDSLAPASDWASPARVPALDNGEMAWSVLAVGVALSQSDAPGAHALSARFTAYFDRLAANAKAAFYAGAGRVASISVVVDPFAPFSPSNVIPDTSGLLLDPYEGETVTVLLDVAASFSTPTERELMWELKRPYMVAEQYTGPTPTLPQVNITVQRGWMFSSHEQWKALLLPYLSAEAPRRVLANCERARTWDAALARIPGLFASVTDVSPNGPGVPPPPYASACGVPSLASARVTRRDVVTPYASFPVWQHNASVGGCWYTAMLRGARMQGPLGSTEAIAVNGSLVSPVVTWDSKITTLLAAVGGVGDLVAAGLAARTDASDPGQSALDRFAAVVQREYATVFFPSGMAVPLAGEGLPLATPQAELPPFPAPQWCTGAGR